MFTSRWNLRDRVVMDGDTSIVGTITALCFRVTKDPTIEVSYLHNGEAKCCWVEEWRLESAEVPAGYPGLPARA